MQKPAQNPGCNHNRRPAIQFGHVPQIDSGLQVLPCRDSVQDAKSMRIASAASAFPKHYYTQRVLLDRLQDYWGDQLKNPLLLARLHRNVTVDGRYLAIPAEQYVDIKTWGQANDIWIKVAQELGEQALCQALQTAGLQPKDLGALLFTTVTGVASPSIDALLINRMGLAPNIRRTPIF